MPEITKVISEYVCPANPSMHGGIVIGGTFAGTSYAANAQVFAPLRENNSVRFRMAKTRHVAARRGQFH